MGIGKRGLNTCSRVLGFDTASIIGTTVDLFAETELTGSHVLPALIPLFTCLVLTRIGFGAHTQAIARIGLGFWG